jgi:hypothetical protein
MAPAGNREVWALAARQADLLLLTCKESRKSMGR